MANVEQIKSGVVHAVSDSGKTVCNRDIVLMRTTDKEVTCERCLKKKILTHALNT